jgi:hypothetical protein
MEAAEQTLANEHSADYKPPTLVELGSVHELTLAACHGGPLDHNDVTRIFCTSR